MRALKIPTIATLLLLAPLTGLAVPTAHSVYDQTLVRKPNIVNGEQLFATCATCHGQNGGGTEDGRIPVIAGQHWQVLSKLLLDFRYFRRWEARMAGISASPHLRGPQEIADVVAYVNSLPAPRATSLGTGEHVAHGAQLYSRLCSACHGTVAEGNGPAGYPRLAGQRYGYLVRQIRDGSEGKRPTYSRQHVQLLQTLDAVDIQGISDYLARIDL